MYKVLTHSCLFCFSSGRVPGLRNWILVPNLSLTGYKMTGLLTIAEALSGSLLCLNTAFDQESRTSPDEAKAIELCN